VTESRDFAAARAQVEPEARKLIARYPESRSALLPILHAFQHVEGWVSPEALAAAAEWLELPLSVVESTASFYTLFFRKPVGKYMLQPCRGLSCAINGAEETMRYFREKLGVGNLETTADGTFSYEEVECLAACDRAPCMQVNLEFFHDLTPEKIDAMLAAMRAGAFDVAPSAQSAAPGPNWRVGQDPVKRSPGAQGVASPNDPGGIGDASGRRMLERLAADPAPVQARPTAERSIVEGPSAAPASRNGNAH
jgi:NADH-quinone oxidoreductase E subunit